MNLLGTEMATFRIVAQCLNQLPTPYPFTNKIPTYIHFQFPPKIYVV